MIQGVYLIQMDCVYKGGQAMPGANYFLSHLVQQKMPFLLLTELSGKTREELAQAMREAGISIVNELDLYSTSMAAVDYVVRKYPERIRVAGIGGKGMKEAIQKGGFINDRKSPDILFVGMNRNMTYLDYSYALQYILGGAKVISTDSRKTMMADGLHQIGNASVIKMLEYASGERAEDFGRGSEHYLLEATRFFKQKPEDIILVGDDFEKDMKPAMALGMTTVFVTKGQDMFELGMNDEVHPTYLVEDLYGLAK